ncbi:MAG: hypothetical protein KDK78_08350, partial [Chlamydiia bacterium]|nr:hypothetical protein [Chlamydiia bacterium]
MTTLREANARIATMGTEHLQEIMLLSHRMQEHQEFQRCENDFRIFAYAIGLLAIGTATLGACAWDWRIVAGGLVVTGIAAINTLSQSYFQLESIRYRGLSNQEEWECQRGLLQDIQACVLASQNFTRLLTASAPLRTGFLADPRKVQFDTSPASPIFRIYYLRLATRSYQTWQTLQATEKANPNYPELLRTAAAMKRLTASFLTYSCRPYL